MRIEDINALRKKTDIQMESGQALELLLGRGENTMFHREESGSEGEDSEERSQARVEGEEFEEIMRIKREVSFNDSHVILYTESCKSGKSNLRRLQRKGKKSI